MATVVGIVHEGDSISSGAYTFPYIGFDTTKVATTIASRGLQHVTTNGVIMANIAQPGSRLDDPSSIDGNTSYIVNRTAIADALIAPTSSPLRVTGIKNNRPTRKYIFSVMIGTNVGNSTGVGSNYTQFATEVGQYCLARRAAGFHALIVGTLLSRGDNILTDEAHFETYRQGYNAIIRGASWQSTYQVNGVFDFGAESTIGAAGACNNLSLYDADKIHPLDSSYAPYMTPLYLATVDTVKATL